MRLDILGVAVDKLDTRSAVRRVEGWIDNGEKRKAIIAINAEKIMFLKREPGLRAFVNRADLLLADGVGVVIAARWLLRVALSRITGVDLMESLCGLAGRKNFKVFFFGATEAVNVRAAENVQKLYPGIRVVGRNHGFVADQDMDALIERINRSGANVLFIALGSPRQEKWLARHLQRLEVNVCQGVGGGFDILSGNLVRSPKGLQKLGLEWLYRLICEPRRIRRQAVLPVFLGMVFRERFKTRGHRAAPDERGR